MKTSPTPARRVPRSRLVLLFTAALLAAFVPRLLGLAATAVTDGAATLSPAYLPPCVLYPGFFF